MPGFRTHTTLNLIALGAVSATWLRQGVVAPELAGIFAASFVVATVFLSPDLDLKHSSPTRNWGPLRYLWRPYQWMFKHRGMSHSVLFSSVTRIAYLLGVGAAIGALIIIASAAEPPSLGDELWTHRMSLSAVGAGIFLSDLAHITADRVLSMLKILVKI